MRISGFIGLDQFISSRVHNCNIQVLFRVSILQKFKPLMLSYLDLPSKRKKLSGILILTQNWIYSIQCPLTGLWPLLIWHL
jgi:hypothetical protein